MTARNFEEQVRDATRAQIQELLVSRGVNQGRVALEVLFWLPIEFVEAYQQLFMEALHLGDGDDQEKAGADEGRIPKNSKVGKSDMLRASGTRGGASVGELEMTPGSNRAAQPGKKYKVEWVVKNERALEIKKRVDRRLRDLVRRERERVDQGREGSPGGNPREEDGGIEERRVTGGKILRRCRECGRIVKGDWVRCPFSHA